MDEKALKTSTGQRIVIVVIAALLLVATFMTYLFVVMSGNGGSSSSEQDTMVAQIAEEYDQKSQELDVAMQPVSEQYFSEFSKYLSNVKAYNAASVTSAGLAINDLKVGTGRTLGEDDLDYGALYIGWCSDGSVFSSSFDDAENPTKINLLINPASGLIEGWNQGVVGMKLGGVRQISMSGELAYGDTNDSICDGANTPLRFIVMAVDPDEKVFNLMDDLQTLQLQLYYAYYGSMM